MERMVKGYYARFGMGEWRRLVKNPYLQLEFDTTMHFLKKYLPKEGSILDAGGGPGRYTIELARLGHDVVLLDLTRAMLKIAKRQIREAGVENRVKQILEGSITDLSMFHDGTFDAVVCLGGPLSHILKEKQRVKAASELLRVAKEDAPIFASVFGRLGVLRGGLYYWSDEIPILMRRMRDRGDYLGGYGFTACHCFLSEELRDLFEELGADVIEMVGLEGLSSYHRRETNRLFKNKRAWRIWVETHLKTCTRPSVVDMSDHLMIVCRK
jgi:SAM-dependent methyltransferase